MTLAGENTEHQILIAAREIFIAKGFEGARMQEIADQAGINKSLLHYYFRSKENLFDAVFSEVAANLFPAIKEVLGAELGIMEKITFFVKIYVKTLYENPFIPAFVINTLNTNPDRFLKYIKKSNLNPMLLQKQIDNEASQGLIRHVKAEHLLVNIISMCIFPFVARPIVQNIFNMNNEEYQKYLESRQNEIIDFVLKSLTV
ncbi:MAG: TetR family transcriptional regulator [Lentimicrobiaceae bacterium]|jgi:AcrR family transcriptional regulator